MTVMRRQWTIWTFHTVSDLNAINAKFQMYIQLFQDRTNWSWLRHTLNIDKDDVTLYRFSEWQQNLTSEHVTVVCRRGAVDHDPVTVVQLLDLKISTELLRLKEKKEK